MSDPHASTPLRYAANLKWLFTEWPFLDRFAAAAEHGFEAVEFASPYEFAANALRQTLKREGLVQVLINTPAAPPGEEGQNGYACIPGKQVEFRDGVRKALYYAGELECGLVHLMAGRIGSQDDHDAAQNVFTENLIWAVEAAKGTGVRYLLECLNQHDAPGYFLKGLDQTASILSYFGPEEVGLLFDAYHCQMSGQDVLKAYQALEPIIQHIQFADAPGRFEPGTGEVPWSALGQLLRTTGYDGWIGCEYRPRTTTVAGLGWRSTI
jgi:hydroxypyruvate isomerase